MVMKKKQIVMLIFVGCLILAFGMARLYFDIKQQLEQQAKERERLIEENLVYRDTIEEVMQYGVYTLDTDIDVDIMKSLRAV